MIPLSSASALTDDFVLFDFTEKSIMKQTEDSEDGIFWTAPGGPGDIRLSVL